MVRRLALLALATGLSANAGAASLYDEALAAYWHEDNVVAFEKCAALRRASPGSADAAHARYLMEVICTTKLTSGMGTQVVARLQQTWQELLYENFSQATAPAEKDRLARKLADLWRVSLLMAEVKEKLAQEHFHIVLRQLGHTYPSWEVKAEMTFPFPDIWTEFTPTLYVNGEVKWAPSSPQMSRSLSVSGSDPSPACLAACSGTATCCNAKSTYAKASSGKRCCGPTRLCWRTCASNLTGPTCPRE